MAKMTLKIPKLGVSMQEGTIVEWCVQSGDAVTLGQKIYVVESEKSSFEVESPFAGTITVLASAGEAMKVGTPIAVIET
jgi:pyruvate/2-oxoglutarate dehydrogenase complex dihydrolipoamide acyltransferase (E2) component